MKNHNLINNLNFENVKYCFVEIFFNSIFYKENANFILFKNIDNLNIEYINSLLTINQDEFKINQNWIWHYYIPLNKNENFLLLCYTNEINSIVLKELKFENIYNNFDIIIDVFFKKINWEDENIQYHSFLWCDQQIVADYLDLICGGLVDFLPFHWTKPSFIKNNNTNWYSNTLWYYNVYLKNNFLEDTEINKINFIKKKLNKKTCNL